MVNGMKDFFMGKLYASEAATNVTRRCAQLAGFDGVKNSWVGLYALFQSCVWLNYLHMSIIS